MTTMSDRSGDLVEEILCRVPVTCIRAVRSTCKGWYTLSKTRIVCKAEARHHILGLISYKLYSVRFNLHGILNEDGKESVDPAVKPIGNLRNHDEISNVFSCDGLLLCVTPNNSKLLVWNPYLGQTRWIRTRNAYPIGKYALGYDNNKNHKILRFFIRETSCEIYDLKSRSWSLFDVIPNREIRWYNRGTSLNGNTYFLCRGIKDGEVYDDFLYCFDFTAERFGQLIDLPFSHYCLETVHISCVKEEKLAAFYEQYDTFVIEIWVTTKIEPNAASWSKFLKIDTKPPTGFDFVLPDDGDSFFIDEEKKVAVVFSFGERHDSSYSAYIIGDNRYLKVVDLDKIVNCQEESVKVRKHWDYLVFSSSYVPSLVQINQNGGRRRKEKKECKNKDKKRKRTNKV